MSMEKLFLGLMAGLLGGAALGVFVLADVLSDDHATRSEGSQRPLAMAPGTGSTSASDAEVNRLQRELDALLEQNSGKDDEIRALLRERDVALAAARRAESAQTAQIERSATASAVEADPQTEEERAAQIAARRQRATTLRATISGAAARKDKVSLLAAIEELKKLGPDAHAEYVAALGEVLPIGTPNENWRGGDQGEDKNVLGLTWEEYNRLLTREVRDHLLLNPTASGASPELLRMAGEQVRWDNYVSREDQVKMLTSLFDAAQSKDVQLTAIRGLRGHDQPEALARLTGAAVNGGLDPDVRESAIWSLSRVADSDERAFSTLQSLESDPNPRVAASARRTVQALRPPVTGYQVTAVYGGQAREVGMQVGDIMTRYNGRAIENEDLRQHQNSIAEGASGEVLIYRNGAIVKVTVRRGQLGINGQFVRKR